METGCYIDNSSGIYSQAEFADRMLQFAVANSYDVSDDTASMDPALDEQVAMEMQDAIVDEMNDQHNRLNGMTDKLWVIEDSSLYLIAIDGETC